MIQGSPKKFISIKAANKMSYEQVQKFKNACNQNKYEEAQNLLVELKVRFSIELMIFIKSTRD